MNSAMCNCRLDARYVRYKNVRGEPLCQIDYVKLGGVVV